MTDECPIAYDHSDDLDECAVCGWTGAVVATRPWWADRPRWQWPEGAIVPTLPVTLCGSDDD